MLRLIPTQNTTHTTHEKGTSVNHVEPSAGIPAPRGISKALSALLRFTGRGGSSPKLVLLAVVAGACLSLLASVSASAAVVRPLVRQISEGAGGSLAGLGGIALDKEDDLWVGVGVSGSNRLEEFAPVLSGSASLESVLINAETEPGSLAVERENGDILLTGRISPEGFNPRVEVFGVKGELLHQWAKFGESAHVAVDNSSDPLDPSACKLSVCTVYVSHEETNPKPPRGDEAPPGIEKFEINSAGESQPASFTAATSYVSGNQIVGAPIGPDACEEGYATFGGSGAPLAMTIDPQGNIYVIDAECRLNTPAVLEYRPSGEFVRAITGEGTPGLDGNEYGGWGGHDNLRPALTGVAFDAASNRLLVSLAVEFSEKEIHAGAVDEFDAATGKYVDQVTEGAEERTLSNPIGIAVDSRGYLYVADRREDRIDVYGEPQVRPNLRLAAVSEPTHETAVLNGSVEPGGLTLSSCRFQYVTEAAFNQSVEEHGGREKEGFADLSSGGEAPCTPPRAAIEPNHTYQPVHAEVTGLISGTVYRYRLLASTEEPQGGPEATAPLAFTAPHAPRIEAAFAGNLSSSYADLHAQIDPLGANTSYRFEYDTTPYSTPAAHGISIPVPGVAIGSGGPTGSVPTSVVQHLAGLAPETTYHFRVVAENEIAGQREVTDGADQTFTTLPSTAPGLPDNRAYELLTPPNKGSSEDMFSTGASGGEEGSLVDFGYPSEAGDGFLLATHAGFGPFPGSGKSMYVFKRGAGGWTYTSLASPALGVQSVRLPAYAPSDLSRVAFVDSSGAPGSATGNHGVGLFGPPGGEYDTLYEGQPQHSGITEGEGTTIIGSRDLSHLVIDSRSHTICPGAEDQDEGSQSLCEYAGGELELVNVNSGGELLSRCGAEIGRDVTIGDGGQAHNAVSADGSRVFFTAPDPERPVSAKNPAGTEGCWNPSTAEHTPQVYMRADGQTIEISAPEAGIVDPSGAHPSAYVGASEDGSRAFFLSYGELTSDDAGIHDLELYEWRADGAVSRGAACEAAEGCLLRISRGESGGAAAVYAVRAISADGTAVYFTAAAKLTATAPVPGEEFGSDELDLYRYDTVTGTTTYVTTVLEFEEPTQSVSDWFSHVIAPGDDRGFAPGPAINWETTPDGSYLLFPTTRPLTGYQTAGCQTSRTYLPGTQARVNGHCEELYRYHFEPGSPAGGSIVCISCNPSGAAPSAHAQFDRSSLVEAVPGAPVHSISDNGSRAFFDTAEALVPQDTNGAIDVYAWDAPGAGGCALARGCVHLISSGTDPRPSFFLGSSADGSSTFFGTHARLVPADADTAGDLYDARICTSAEPCIAPPTGETAQCEGDACQTVPPPPVDATPGSLTFSGAGNLSPLLSSPAAKPRVKPKALSSKQKLANALRACRKKPRKRRAPCERHAREHFAKATTKGKR